MRFSFLFRLIGALLYGFIGYELAVAFLGTFELTSSSAPIIWGATPGRRIARIPLSPPGW